MQHDFQGSPVAQQDYGPLLGAPFKVFLMNGVIEHIDAATGKPVTEIVDLPGLIAAIVRTRVLHPRKLSGDDLKYIRSALCLKSIDVAKSIDFTPEHYSRCETGTKTMSADKEKFYRMYIYILSFLKDRELHEAIENKLCLEQPLNSSPEKMQKTMKAFCKIFLEMKLDMIYSVEDELALSLKRGYRIPEDGDDGGADGDWLSELDRDAA